MNKGELRKKQRIKWLLSEAPYRFARFKGAAYMRGPRGGYQPFDRDEFGRMCHEKWESSVSEGNINDLAETIRTVAPDLTHTRHLVAFGASTPYPQVWNMETLSVEKDAPLDWIYQSDITPTTAAVPRRAVEEYLLQLANGDPDLAQDYLQAMAPIFMADRPSGAVWFVGDGANGKSSLLNALYRGFAPFFASLTLKAIEDGRALPALRGKLGNIVRESSEARVEDSEAYKAIGTHEPLTIRLMRQNDTVAVDTDMHTIFNANNVPIFSDKTKGARRRTLVIPFPAHFKDDPSFEKRTFTPEFLGALFQLILEATHTIRDNNFQYKWSEATKRAKSEYDDEVNSVEAFLKHLQASGVVGFSNYQTLRLEYENWCAKQGYVPLGVVALKRTITNDGGAERRTLRDPADNKTYKRYLLVTAPDPSAITWLDIGIGVRTDPLVLAEKTELDKAW